MTYLLGIDTGGTYTDAVLLDDERDVIVAKAKSLTTRPDLSIGIGAAVDAVLSQSAIAPEAISMVSLSTTLATNALVEGQGGRVGLVFIGFDQSDFEKADLAEALGDDPVWLIAGGHNHAGHPIHPFDQASLKQSLETVSGGISGFAIASKFATRNPEHELAAREIVRAQTGLPVTCSHELSQSLGGPKRALTAVLNARLIGLIDRLITATKAHMAARKIDARLMVVRGDGALVGADMARERPIETILSGPAASIAGAQWLTGEQHALVSDIGGTTTDVCLLREGLPTIDPQGAKVGKYRTMVEAVAMRTFGLGGDSEVHIGDGLDAQIMLGPQRVMPVSLLAVRFPDVVRAGLDRSLTLETPQAEATRFALAQFDALPSDLDTREAAVAARLLNGPLRWADAVQSRVEGPALARLVKQGLAIIADVTPSDASHVLGVMDTWDSAAATKALTLLARRRIGSGERLADGPEGAATKIIAQVTEQTSLALLETAFAEEGWSEPDILARHELIKAGRQNHSDVLRLTAGLSLPVIGLGASAKTYYGAVGTSVGTETILPENGDVANAIGAVVGQVSVHVEGSVSASGEGAFRVHSPSGPAQFSNKDEAITALRSILTSQARDQAVDAGVEEPQIQERLNLREAQIEAQTMFIEAEMRITARGRPRISR